MRWGRGSSRLHRWHGRGRGCGCGRRCGCRCCCLRGSRLLCGLRRHRGVLEDLVRDLWSGSLGGRGSRHGLLLSRGGFGHCGCRLLRLCLGSGCCQSCCLFLVLGLQRLRPFPACCNMAWLARTFSVVLRITEKPQNMWDELVGVLVQELFRAVLRMTVDAGLSFWARRGVPPQAVVFWKHQLIL